MLLLTAAYGLCTVLTAVVGGIWSDRLGRRKVFVIASGLVAAAALLLLAFVTDLGRRLRRRGDPRHRLRHLHRRRLRDDHPGAALGRATAPRTSASSTSPTRCRRCSRPGVAAIVLGLGLRLLDPLRPRRRRQRARLGAGREHQVPRLTRGNRIVVTRVRRAQRPNSAVTPDYRRQAAEVPNRNVASTVSLSPRPTSSSASRACTSSGVGTSHSSGTERWGTTVSSEVAGPTVSGKARRRLCVIRRKTVDRLRRQVLLPVGEPRRLPEHVGERHQLGEHLAQLGHHPVVHVVGREERVEQRDVRPGHARDDLVDRDHQAGPRCALSVPAHGAHASALIR